MAIWLVVFGELSRSGAETQREAERTAINLAKAFEEHVASLTLMVDQSLLRIRHDMRGMTDRQLHEYLKSYVFSPAVVQIAILDPKGILTHSSVAEQIHPFNLSDREHFAVHRDGSQDFLFVSKPYLSRVTNRWVLQFTRKLMTPDGRFDGVAVLSIDPTYFVDIYHSIDIGKQGSIFLVGMDRVVRAHASHMQEQQDRHGQTLADQPFFAPESPDWGAYEFTGSSDNVQRIGAWRRVPNQSLVVLVLLSRDEVFDGWSARRTKLLLGASVISVALVLSVLLLSQAWRQQAETARALRVQADNLRHANHELENRNEDLAQFAYVASHDLREPLRIVSGFATLLERHIGPTIDPTLKEYVQFIVDGVKRMDRMTLDLLDYSCLSGEGAATEQVDLRLVIAEALDNLGLRVAKLPAEVEVAGDFGTVAGERVRLVQLIQNLIANAVKFRHPDRLPKVAIAGRREDGWVVIDVTDNGIGMEPKYFDEIFKIFRRLHSQGAFSGSGIGLAMCKRIVERHGGSMSLTSTLGQGTTFQIRLPIMAGPVER